MLLYGEGFADHLRALIPPGAWPWLADLARIDRCRTEAHAAVDTPVLTSAELAMLPAGLLAATVLVPAPATRRHHHPDAPVLALDAWWVGRHHQG